MDFELNIYGKDDAIIKTYQTAHVRWGVFIKAMQLQEELKDADTENQFSGIAAFVRTLFEGMTEDELMQADAFDVMNVFTQLVNKAKGIGKNA